MWLWLVIRRAAGVKFMATMAVSLFMAANSLVKLNFPIVVKNVPIESFRVFLKPVRCLPVQQQVLSILYKPYSFY